MTRETLRRRRIPIGVVVLLFAAWLASGIRRTGPDEGSIVLDAPLGFPAARLVEPGWHLAPPGLLRLTTYPEDGRTFTLNAGEHDRTLITNEGTAILTTVTVHYRVDPERVLELHGKLGHNLEREALEPWILEDLRHEIASKSYSEISGARAEELRLALGRSLDGRFREVGLGLLALDVRSVQIRDSTSGGPVESAPIQGARVLLIGLDGADWNILDPLIESGRLPNLARLARTGVRSRLRTLTPMLSPVIWTSVATGVRPGRHGIVDFVATVGPDRKRVPVRSTLRKVKAIWNILGEQQLQVGVVGWWVTFPAERVNGFIVSDRVARHVIGPHRPSETVGAGKLYPPDLEEVIAPLRIAPESIPTRTLRRYMRIGEDAIPLPADQGKMVDDFRTLLAAGDTYSRIALKLQADRDPDFLAVYFEGTDTVAHLFMPFAPPPLDGIDRDAARRFSRTVNAYYAHVDGEIGRLVKAVGPDTAIIICSDHGFRTGEHRPLTDSRIGYGMAADWHRKYGVLILNGPPFRRGVELEEASVLDITPTVLTLFGLPVAEDLDGRPIIDALRPEFLAAHPVRYRPTYEGGVVETARSWEIWPGPEEPQDPEGDRELKQKLESLGYLRQDTANSHNNRGMLLLKQGKLDEAIAEFRIAIDSSEDFAIAYINIARANLRKGDLEAAVASLDAYLKRRPRSKDAENLLGNVRMEQGRLDEAEAHFRKALRYEPNYTEARNSLGLLYDRVGKTEEALAEFSRAVEIDHDYAEPHNNIGLIHKRAGRLDEAIDRFKRAIRADAEFAGSYSNLALVYEERGEFAAAEDQFRKALRRDRNNAVVRANFGGLLYVLGRSEEARRELERAIAIDPGHATAHNNLGAVFGRLGRGDDEIASYREAVRLDSDYADAHHNLGLALLKRGQVEAGESELRRTLDLNETYVSAYLTLAGSCLGRDAPEEAVDVLTRGARAVAGDSTLHALLAEALLRIDRETDAIEALERSLELEPDQPELRIRLDQLNEQVE